VPPSAGERVRTSARYREKSPEDLRWNFIRRQLTRDLDTAIMNRREEILNILLSRAWDDYVKALETGEVIELEARYGQFVEAIVGDILPAGDEVEDAA
jgi:hypothetical protein